MKFLFAFLIIVSFSFANKKIDSTSVGNDSDLIARGATLHLIANSFSFTEGATVDKKGNIYFTDQPNNKIWKYDKDGKLSLYLDSAGRSNGMFFDKKGNLVTCADENNQLWSIGKNKKITVLINDLNGKKLNGPNDTWIAPNGNIYFTDPYYQRPYWTRTKPELDKRDVYLLSKKNKQVSSVASDFQQPNGIVGSPDGRYLYVADINANKTYRFDINKNGELTNKILFVEQGSDGMVLDEQGNLYLTGKGVTVFNKSGKKICFIEVPQQTSNLAFGGKHKDELFITAREAIYTLKMKVHGVE